MTPTNAQMALLAAATYDPGGGSDNILMVADKFLDWLNERSDPERDEVWMALFGDGDG